jgi:hypothetical protein
VAAYVFVLCILYNISLLRVRSQSYTALEFSFFHFRNQPDDGSVFYSKHVADLSEK